MYMWGSSAIASPSTPKSEEQEPEPLGKRPVPWWGILLILLYLLPATAVCVTALTQMWPHPTPSGRPPENQDPKLPKTWQQPTQVFLDARCGTDKECITCEKRAHAMREHLRINDYENDPECVHVLGVDYVMWNERRLLFIVILAGMTGGLLYALRSFFWYVGNRKLVWSWIALYLISPFTSALLAVITYLVIRGGFFSAGSTVGDTSPYAFAALAGLVGMFHRETAEKLRQIFEVIFTKAEVGNNAAVNPKPVLTAVTFGTSVGSPANDSVLTLKGDHLIADSIVNINGRALKNRPHFVTEHELRVLLEDGEIPAGSATIDVSVTNPPPGGGTSDKQTVAVPPSFIGSPHI